LYVVEPDIRMRRIPPRRLVFSGGGIRVVSYLGILQVLEEKKQLGHLRELCGVSAGALVSLLLALQYRLSVIERFCMEYDFGQVRSEDPEHALEFFEQYGIDDGSALEKLIHKILYHKGFGPDTTFQQLAASGRVKTMRVWASDIQNLEPIEFSAIKTPHISVAFALKASMAIPLYFIPPRHPTTGNLIVDGGVFDNYPMSLLTEQEAEESLGITFSHPTKPVLIPDFATFVSLLTVGYYIPSYRRLIERHRSRTIEIPCADFSATHFEASKEERQELVAKGRQAAERFFSTKERPNLIRRHSVS
jgi:NTE family protein